MKFEDEQLKKDLIDILNAKMPFGKYEGKPLVYIPEFYLTWFKGKLGRQLSALQEMKANGLEDFLIDLFKKHQAS